jgi:magnesium transporter
MMIRMRWLDALVRKLTPAVDVRANDSRRLAEQVRRRFRRQQDVQAAQILGEHHPREVATALRILEVADQLRLLRLMEGAEAAAVLRHMNRDDLVGLVRALTDHDLVGLIEHLSSDAIPRLVDRLGPAQATRVVQWIRGGTLRGVAGTEFGIGTAGWTMRPGLWAVSENGTVGQAIECVRGADVYSQPSMLFVVDSHRHLVGAITVAALFGLAPSAPIRLIQTRRTMTVGPGASHREVARLAIQYSLQAVAVVDAKGCFLGSLIADDLFSILRDELANSIDDLS